MNFSIGNLEENIPLEKLPLNIVGGTRNEGWNVFVDRVAILSYANLLIKKLKNNLTAEEIWSILEEVKGPFLTRKELKKVIPSKVKEVEEELEDDEIIKCFIRELNAAVLEESIHWIGEISHWKILTLKKVKNWWKTLPYKLKEYSVGIREKKEKIHVLLNYKANLRKVIKELESNGFETLEINSYSFDPVSYLALELAEYNL